MSGGSGESELSMKWILVAVLAPALFAALVIGNRIRIMQTPEFQIDTHKRQMLLMHHFAYADPKVGPKGLIYHSPNKSLEKYEFHRQRLRELGAVCYREYAFQHILTSTIECRHLNKLLFSPTCPNYLDWSYSQWSATNPADSQPLILKVWCYAEDEAAWDKLVAERDVADYRERFMSNNPVR